MSSSNPSAKSSSSRRDFLVQSARAAAVAGIASAAYPLNAQGAQRGPKLEVNAGPKPRSIGPNDTIRFGLIGIGGQGRHDLQRLLKNPNISIKALADPDPVNAQRCVELVKELTGETIEVYPEPDDWKTKLLGRDDIDAVLTATPCYLHGPIHLACFAAGKHFYGEKPMCIEANEADALIEAQKKNPHVKAQIGYQRRATQLYAEGIKRIREGLIGELIDGRGAWNNSWGPIGLPSETAEKWPGRIWLGRRKYSGDWMLEQACHTWDVFCWAADAMPVAASGYGRRDIFIEMDPKRDVTDYYIAHLEFPNGFYVDFEHSWFCPKTDVRDGKFAGVFERIAGREGGLCLNDGLFMPRKDQVKRNGETIKLEPVDYRPQEPDHIESALAAFVRSIRHDEPVICDVTEGRNATYTGLLVREAVEQGRRVEMKELM